MSNLSKYEKALYYEIFQLKEYSFLDTHITSSKIIFDIGGHFGFFSKYCFDVNSNIIIHFFEPLQNNFNFATTYLADYSSKIFFNNYGVSFVEGFNNIFVDLDKSMQASLYNNTILNKSNISYNAFFVNLDNYINSLNGINSIDILKLDVEGMEFDILLNFKLFSKIKVLFFEYHLFDNSLVSKYLQLLDLINKYFKNVTIINSKYSNNFGYIVAYNGDNIK